MSLSLITTNTPDGLFYIIADKDGVARVSGYGSVADLQKRLPVELRSQELVEVKSHPYSTLISAYYNGDPDALHKIPRDQDGSDFQRRVWNAISDIKPGSTISYKELAEQSSNPAAVRAAGTVCGLNRLILLIPCHRVLKSDGSIGSYLYGPVIKESLLRHEGVLA